MTQSSLTEAGLARANENTESIQEHIAEAAATMQDKMGQLQQYVRDVGDEVLDRQKQTLDAVHEAKEHLVVLEQRVEDIAQDTQSIREGVAQLMDQLGLEGDKLREANKRAIDVFAPYRTSGMDLNNNSMLEIDEVEQYVVDFGLQFEGDQRVARLLGLLPMDWESLTQQLYRTWPVFGRGFIRSMGFDSRRIQHELGLTGRLLTRRFWIDLAVSLDHVTPAVTYFWRNFTAMAELERENLTTPEPTTPEPTSLSTSPSSSPATTTTAPATTTDPATTDPATAQVAWRLTLPLHVPVLHFVQAVPVQLVEDVVLLGGGEFTLKGVDRTVRQLSDTFQALAGKLVEFKNKLKKCANGLLAGIVAVFTYQYGAALSALQSTIECQEQIKGLLSAMQQQANEGKAVAFEFADKVIDGAEQVVAWVHRVRNDPVGALLSNPMQSLQWLRNASNFLQDVFQNRVSLPSPSPEDVQAAVLQQAEQQQIQALQAGQQLQNSHRAFVARTMEQQTRRRRDTAAALDWQPWHFMLQHQMGQQLMLSFAQQTTNTMLQQYRRAIRFELLVEPPVATNSATDSLGLLEDFNLLSRFRVLTQLGAPQPLQLGVELTVRMSFEHSGNGIFTAFFNLDEHRALLDGLYHIRVLQVKLRPLVMTNAAIHVRVTKQRLSTFYDGANRSHTFFHKDAVFDDVYVGCESKADVPRVDSQLDPSLWGGTWRVDVSASEQLPATLGLCREQRVWFMVQALPSAEGLQLAPSVLPPRVACQSTCDQAGLTVASVQVETAPRDVVLLREYLDLKLRGLGAQLQQVTATVADDHTLVNATFWDMPSESGFADYIAGAIQDMLYMAYGQYESPSPNTTTTVPATTTTVTTVPVVAVQQSADSSSGVFEPQHVVPGLMIGLGVCVLALAVVLLVLRARRGRVQDIKLAGTNFNMVWEDEIDLAGGDEPARDRRIDFDERNWTTSK